MATRPKAVIESRNGEKFSPITITKNVLTDDGQNLHDILSDRKEDMMTPTIENSSSMFKVGQGDNVDYSENVVDGAYESCVLKGKSLINILKAPVQTLSGGDSGWKRLNPRWSLKANTKYFALYFVDSNTLNGTIKDVFKYGDDQTIWGIDVVPIGGVGVFKRTFTLSSEITEYNCYTDTSTTGSANVKCVLLEYQEGIEDLDIPYFEGICDCKSPILSNVGKNLFDGSYEKDKFINEHGTISDSADWCATDFIRVRPNTTYTQNKNIPSSIVYFCFYNEDKQLISTTRSINYNRTFTTPNNCHFIRTSWKYSIDGFDFQFEEGTETTTYEDYKTNILRTSEEIVLRSLPNGVCDTLNVETGEYIQRIGEITFDGSNDENWQMITEANNWTNGMKNILTFNYPKPSNCALTWSKDGNESAYLSNKFPSVQSVDKYAKEDKEKLMFDQRDIKMAILKSKLNTQDLVGFKAWLQANPVTVQYELVTPIISTVDIQGFPYAYTNGHVQLSSGSIEQSLTPKVEYSVVTNRNGQIRSNQKMVERHQKQLDHLQAMILTNLVNTQYEQTLTNLKYDLKNVREEVK